MAAAAEIRIVRRIHLVDVDALERVRLHRERRQCRDIGHPVHRHDARTLVGGYAVACVRHAQRIEQFLFQELIDRHIRRFFDHVGERVGGDAVAVLRAWLERQRLVRQHAHGLIEGTGAVAAEVDGAVVLRNVAAGDEFVSETGAVGEEVLHRDGALRWLDAAVGQQDAHVGERAVELRQHVVQAQLALLDEDEAEDRDDGLRHGVDAVQRPAEELSVAGAVRRTAAAAGEHLAFAFHQPFDPRELTGVRVALGDGGDSV